MPRKRDRILQIFNLSRKGPSRPPSPIQQPRNVTTSGSTSFGPPASSAPSTTKSNPHASQAGLLRAVSPAPNATSSIASSCSKDAVGVVWEGVKKALFLLKESSDWLPQLKSATGGLVALIDAIETWQKIDGLTCIIKENSRDRTFPWLRRRLSEFAGKLNEIVGKIDIKSNHGRLRRFAERGKDKNDITSFAGAISELVTNLQSELVLYTSHGFKELLSNESLKKLKESETARYDAPLGAIVQRRACTPTTRKKILEDLMKWAKDPRSSRMYWMNGMAGTGKTTITYSFCEQLQEDGLLGANFFCSRSLAECSDIQYIIPTIARQLARSCPEFASALLQVLDGDFQLPSFRNQLKRLLLEPYGHIPESVTDTLIIVIDALDECSNDASEIRLFLKLLSECVVAKIIPLKVFITSRPEDAISRTITPSKHFSPSEWSIVHIHDIEESLVQADIKIFVEDELTLIAETRGLREGWPPNTEVDAVVGNANRLFIYAATVIRIILERALHKKNQEEIQMTRVVLTLIVCAQAPLTLAGIADLLNASEYEILASDVRTALELLPSVISTPIVDDGVASTFHASFPDFLFDDRRCGSTNHIPLRRSHQEFARLCLHYMDKSLTVDNIRGSGRWQSVDTITKQQKVESWTSGAVAYACMYWASHIDTDEEIESLSAELDLFLGYQLLRWLEVLSLLRRLDIGFEVLQRMKERKHPTLSSKFDDAYKFLKDIFDYIKVWPCEVFHSGLVWAPEQSFIRKTYLKSLSVRIVCGHRAGWGACELTIRGRSGEVLSVVFSPDNCRVASGSHDGTVRIWNASTGEEEHVLRGHSGSVMSVAFSPDNRRVASGSGDSTVRIWNAMAGEGEHVLRGHSSLVMSAAFSPDNRHVVSGSHDNTVHIWNASTGEKEHDLRGHSGPVKSVAFSPDNRYVVSGSHDNTVVIWDISTGGKEHVLRGPSWVRSVAFSPDNRHVLSGSRDKTVRIWNALTGEEENVLRGHSDWVESVAFSPDNRRAVSGSRDETVRIWNASTGEEEHVLRGHSMVNSVSVSTDNRHVVFGSVDTTVRIWDVSSGEEEGVLRGHSSEVESVAVSPDNCHVVSGSRDKTVRIWDTSTGKEEHVFRGHYGLVSSVAVSSNNRHVVSGSRDKTVRIWNVTTGEVHVLRGHSDSVRSVAISPDNLHIVSGSEDKTVRIWNAMTGEEEHVLRGHSDWVESVAVSPDNLHIVSGSHWQDKTVRIWNATTGEEELVLRGHSDSVSSVAVSPDSPHVVSESNDNTVRIWKMLSGEEEPPVVISFTDFDNYRVMSGLHIKAIPIGRIFLSSMVTSIAFLAQGDSIASIPLLQRLASGESLDLEVLLQARWKGLPLLPVTLAPDGWSILLSNGKRCLAIPSTLRDIRCAAFSGSKVYFGHESGRITILDIAT